MNVNPYVCFADVKISYVSWLRVCLLIKTRIDLQQAYRFLWSTASHRTAGKCNTSGFY